MLPESWQHDDLVMRLVEQALARRPAEREAYVRTECAGNSQLFQEVWNYVAAEERMNGFLLKPLYQGSQDTLPPTIPDRAALEPEPRPADLPGILGGRFRVLSRLGAGGFGDVYRVIDDAAGREPLALKVLRSPDAAALQYFKREFRALAGMNHRNIVALHELISDGDRWMFTMEFVEGVDLLQFFATCPKADWEAHLCSCLAQLADGLQALHERNLLHRDLKPSNVLVTGAARLVLLDFGLVHGFGDSFPEAATIAGTPNYMSPEQAIGEPLRQPSDWYAVGVMLYQILTGQLPFVFDSHEVLRTKQFERPVPPSQIATAVPEKLSELCIRLLDPDPLQRAGYADVLSAVTGQPVVPVREQTGTGLFVGRKKPLRQLQAAYLLAEDHPVLVHVCGPSGMGKTALLQEWMGHLRNERTALVFAGRCYEGESIPYKAIDDLVDNIAQHLRRLPRERVEQFLPRNFAALVEMFPILSPFLSSRMTMSGKLRPADLRTRAFDAFRELLGRLSEHYRISLVIDDLQWGDPDGCATLSALLSSSDSPPILVVLAYRSEDIGASSWLKELRDGAGPQYRRTTMFIDLDRLESAEAAEFARSLLAWPENSATVHHVVEQSGGNPFLIHEMVRWINARGSDSSLGPFSLADVVRSRVTELTPECRHLLELVAVAGQPTELSILKTAAGIGNMLAARDQLVAARLVRLRYMHGHDEIEVYHDRIRTTITTELDAAALVVRHREIASGLEAAAASDPERIAIHYEKAQEPNTSSRYALEGARRAVKVLAFHRAAGLFEMALRSQALDEAERRAAHKECADALANTGRGPEAAEHYLAAGVGVAIDEQLECNLRAAEQLLYTGHIDRGLTIFGTILGQVGVAWPKKPSWMYLQLLLRRAQLRVRGLRWRETAAVNLPRSVLLKIDTCGAVAVGLSLVDIARGATLQSTSLLLALRAGEPGRIARALAMEAAYRSTAGIKAQNSVERLLALARELSGRAGDPRAIGLTGVIAAACAWNSGRWEECYVRAQAARKALEERHERIAWERDTASIFEVDGLRWMGRWAAMKALLPELLKDARARGDLYAEAILQMHGGSCAALANDDPEGASAGLAILDHWSNTGFHVEHLVEMHNQIEIAMYRRRGREAAALTSKRWPALRKSLLLRVQSFRIQMRSLRGRAAICAALEETSVVGRGQLLRMARRDSCAIKREGAVWGRALAELIEGGIESLKGRRERAMHAFRCAEASANAANMIQHAAAARYAQAILIGGDTGRLLLETAYRVLSAEGIANPERLCAVMAPGLRPSS